MSAWGRRHCIGAGIAATAAAGGGPAFGQAFPGKQIRWVIPFAPGGNYDVTSRIVADPMGRQLGQSILIDNKPGAGGVVGLELAYNAPADGYTIVMASFTVGYVAPIFAGKKEMLSQFAPVSILTTVPTLVVVRADSPWKTYADFIAYAKANPGRISFGSSGNYGTMHVPMEQLKAATSTFMLHVPYTGAGPAVLSLLGGQIEALSTGPASVKQHIASGRLRALAHWGDGRLASMPTVPSFKELGVPIQYSQWSGMFVPADTPAAVVDILRQAAKFAAQDARAVGALTAAGTSFMYQDAPEFERFVQDDAKDMSALVIRIGKVD